jgi:hypothetical protein
MVSLSNVPAGFSEAAIVGAPLQLLEFGNNLESTLQLVTDSCEN